MAYEYNLFAMFIFHFRFIVLPTFDQLILKSVIEQIPFYCLLRAGAQCFYCQSRQLLRQRKIKPLFCFAIRKGKVLEIQL